MSQSRFRVTLVVAVLSAIGGFAGGYFPERTRRVAAEGQTEGLRAVLGPAEARIRVGGLLGRGLILRDLVTGSDYGQAQQVSSAFFDAVRAEAQSTSDVELRGVLTAVLAQRDVITTALARSDPTVVEPLRSIERRLRGALGYQVTREETESAPPPDPPMR